MLGIGALVLMVASLQHLHLAFLLHQPIHSAPFGMFSPFLQHFPPFLVHFFFGEQDADTACEAAAKHSHFLFLPQQPRLSTPDGMVSYFPQQAPPFLVHFILSLHFGALSRDVRNVDSFVASSCSQQARPQRRTEKVKQKYLLRCNIPTQVSAYPHIA